MHASADLNVTFGMACRYGSFLTEEECDHLIKLAKPNMRDSTILDKASGKQIPNRCIASTLLLHLQHVPSLCFITQFLKRHVHESTTQDN